MRSRRRQCRELERPRGTVTAAPRPRAGASEGRYADGARPARRYFKRYVDSRHQQQHSKIAYRKGTLAGSCDTQPALWRKEHFPGWNVNWFNAFQPSDDLKCEIWEDAPTLIIERDSRRPVARDAPACRRHAPRCRDRTGARDREAPHPLLP